MSTSRMRFPRAWTSASRGRGARGSVRARPCCGVSGETRCRGSPRKPRRSTCSRSVRRLAGRSRACTLPTATVSSEQPARFGVAADAPYALTAPKELETRCELRHARGVPGDNLMTKYTVQNLTRIKKRTLASPWFVNGHVSETVSVGDRSVEKTPELSPPRRPEAVVRRRGALRPCRHPRDGVTSRHG